MSLPLLACSRRRDPSRLSFWAMDVEAENSKPILTAFSRRTGVPVDLQWLAWHGAHEKLLTAFAGGTLPDVFMISRAWVAEFALIGAIRPLPPEHADLLADGFAPRDLRIGGHEFAVPWTLDLSVQYYRRDLLAAVGYAAPPTEFEEWRTMLRAVKRRQHDAYAILMQLDWPDHLMHIAEQQSDPLLRDRQSRGNFRSPGFRTALGFYKSLFDEALAPRASSIEISDPASDLARGWIAIYPAGSWNRAELLRRPQAIPRARWATAPMAGRRGGARARLAGAVLCVSHTAPDPERAWALVRHLVAQPSELQLFRLSGALPSRRSAWAAPAMTDPALRSFAQALTRTLPSHNLPEWERIGDDVQLVAERVVRGDLTVDAAVAEIDQRVDVILAKRRWLLDTGRLS